MLSRPTRLVGLLAGCALIMGFGGSVRLADARFAVTNVTISGPGSIRNGASATYTVTVSISRNAGAPATLIGTQGPPPPRIRPSLYSGSTQLTRTEIDFGPGVNSAAVQLSLTCSNNEVRGNLAGTGAGARAGSSGFLGWPWWDQPASIKGHLNERDSASLNVLCTS